MSTGANTKPEHAGQRLNSLGVDQEKLDALLRKVRDLRGGEDQGSLRRSFIRWHFACPSVELRLDQAGNAQSVIRVVARDLSSTGVGLLHSNFVYPGTPCTVQLTNSGGTTSQHRGTVVRCQHVSGVVHEVGVHFEKAIDPGLYVESKAASNGSQVEAVDPATLTGYILYADESRLDGKVFKHFLSKTRVRVDICEGFDEALEKAQKSSHDLIVCNAKLAGDTPGSKLIAAIREHRPNTPVLILTAEERGLSKPELEQIQANGFLTKPLREDLLLQTLTEYIAVTQDAGGVITSSLAPDDPARALVDEFARDLATKAKSLRASMDADDAMGAYAVCLQIAGVAPALGFDKVGIVAKQAGETLAASMSVQESSRQLKVLIDCCTRVEAA